MRNLANAGWIEFGAGNVGILPRSGPSRGGSLWLDPANSGLSLMIAEKQALSAIQVVRFRAPLTERDPNSFLIERVYRGNSSQIGLPSGMQKDTVPKPMEPFTLEEESGLVGKLEALSVASLESYVASARAALGSNALAATWRTRIELGARHAEQALTKAQAAAALAAIALPPAPPVVASKSKKVAALVAIDESEQADDEA